MQPGGVWEQLHTNHMQEQCFVMKRMGFMRLAMKYGRDIVPLVSSHPPRARRAHS